jgi:GT2 family glycosyltransferase
MDGSRERSTFDLSFVIPVRTDAVRLQRCLQSINDNDYPRDRVEIIVVDNGSTDDSAAVATRAGARVVVVADGSVSLLRNRGAAEARGAILAFVDADHAIAPAWIRRAVELIQQRPHVVAVGSLCHAPENGTWVQHAYDRLRRRADTIGPAEWLGTGNLAVRRSAFLAAGGFDEGLITCEDVDLCKKLRRGGGVILTDPVMRNVHFGDPDTIWALFTSELWRGRNNLTVSLRRPVQASDLPSVGIPLLQLSGVIAAVLLVAWGGRPLLPLATVALIPLALLPMARAVWMSARRGRSSITDYVRNATVAFTYDAARALALVAFARHTVRRS